MLETTVFGINTTDGMRYGLKNKRTGDVLYGATARFKSERGAINYATRHNYSVDNLEGVRVWSPDATVSPADVSQIGGTNQWPPANTDFISRADWVH